MREQIASRLHSLDAALSPTLPAFLTLLDAPVDDPHWHALDPTQRRQRILEALKRLLLRESQVQPVVLVVENPHWIASEKLRHSHGPRHSLPTVRLLLRQLPSGVSARWGEQLPLLSVATRCRAIMPRNCWAMMPGWRRLRPRLIDWTEGNPFFLEETIQMLVETGVLVGVPGVYQLAKAVPFKRRPRCRRSSPPASTD